MLTGGELVHLIREPAENLSVQCGTDLTAERFRGDPRCGHTAPGSGDPRTKYGWPLSRTGTMDDGKGEAPREAIKVWPDIYSD